MADFDVAIVGASIAGSTAAALFARAGARVALIESHADPGAYKRACTHMVQSSANAVLERLGVAGELEAAGGVRTAVETWTEGGWIVDVGDRPAGLNLCVRRSVLDPLLRRRAADTRGVELLSGERATGLLGDGGSVAGVVTARRRIAARLVVGADGRGSAVAAAAQLPERVTAVARVAHFAYYRGARRREERAQVWLSGGDVLYAFPAGDELTLLAAFSVAERLPAFKRDAGAALRAAFAGLDRAPDLDAAEQVAPVVARVDLQNVSRPAAMAGLALVGDAALTSDPAVGVGCGWALQSAEWLVDETAAALTGGTDLDAALHAYRARHDAALGPHQRVIAEGSRARAPSRAERTLLSAAAKDPELARRFHDYATRNAAPRAFLGPGTMLRAAWVDATRRRPGA